MFILPSIKKISSHQIWRKYIHLNAFSINITNLNQLQLIDVFSIGNNGCIFSKIQNCMPLLLCNVGWRREQFILIYSLICPECNWQTLEFLQFEFNNNISEFGSNNNSLYTNTKDGYLKFKSIETIEKIRINYNNKSSVLKK